LRLSLNEPAPAIEYLGGFVGNAAALFEIFAAQLGHVAATFGKRLAAFGAFAHDAPARNIPGCRRKQERYGCTDGYSRGQPEHSRSIIGHDYILLLLLLLYRPRAKVRYRESMNQQPVDPQEPDASASMDLVEIFRGMGATAEIEAMSIHSVLEAGGIDSVIIGASELPNLSFIVRVPKKDVVAANELLKAARDGGPQAAEEAHRAGESGTANS
jgi:hypothetical protein